MFGSLYRGSRLGIPWDRVASHHGGHAGRILRSCNLTWPHTHSDPLKPAEPRDLARKRTHCKPLFMMSYYVNIYVFMFSATTLMLTLYIGTGNLW